MPRGEKSEVGTEVITPQGYVSIKTPRGWILKHRLIAEAELGRPLEPNERIKFKDGNKRNCSWKNLEIVGTKDPEDPVRRLHKRLIRAERVHERLTNELAELRVEIESLRDVQASLS